MKTLIAALVAALVTAMPAFAESPRIFTSIGQQQSVNSTEGQMRYIGPRAFWNLQPVLGVSYAGNGSAYIGAGSAYTLRSDNSGLFARLSSIAGIHKRGSGRNLGGPIQFRTSIDVGVMTSRGTEFGIGADHRSSARIYRPNPGLNTVYMFATLPLR
ncbi:MAG: acyloxyacyl hydrolase [Rhodobacteraceae bacterium]|nr:acyloxyacyl hydrolase [Paracoccaceae bacterium]